MEKLIESLETLLIRIECGQTPLQATRGLPCFAVPVEVASDWARLRELIDAGSIPAKAAVSAFLKHIKVCLRLETLLAQRLLLPKLQSKVISWGTLGLIPILWFLFPKEMRPDGILIGFSIGLLLVGHLWIRALLKKFERKLWFSGWLQLLSRLQGLIEWGHTLPSALTLSLERTQTRDWPPALARELHQQLARMRNGNSPRPRDPSSQTTPQDLESARAFEQLGWIVEQYDRGEPVGPLLNALTPPSLESFERRLVANADRLSFEMLSPLFTCHMSAALILIFGPILKSLSQLKV